ncbi:methyltransferase MtaA/CmuA family [Desulfofundulus kuznetsovii DSM 6115]|uniref:Methyltransferase MtaA/CmuA family n=1 Tax=Desulfofundulus kuznetsovii (strain DSM 6115 / VKM B-1805 / 17) TaxID=760568 RepID=A0AAU8P9C3_DESK7|nr:methyltransferase MtaA/CmuA family [Desulfofundulus kuznetsovii DSM 6115]
MTGRERVLKALAGEETDRLPVLSVNQTATYEQMEELKVYWPEANFRAQEMARLASGAYTILGFDAVRVPFCQTIEAEALGCPIKDGGRNNLPSPADYPYKPGDQPAMPGDYLQRGRIPELIEALKLLKEMVGDKALVIGGIIGPYSIAGSLIGATDLMRASFRKPHLVEPLMEVGELAGRLLARELIKAGADAICIEDMMASLDMISPKIYRELVMPWHKKLLDELQDVPTIIHICGKLDDVIEDIASLGVTAISVENKVDAPKAVEKLKKYNRHIPLIGGVDAAHTLFSGNVEKVKEEVRKAIADGYSMIAPGCSIPPATTIACLRAMVDEVIGYSQ